MSNARPGTDAPYGGYGFAEAMKNSGSFRRNSAAIGLLASAVLTTISVMASPAFPSGYQERLAAINAGGPIGAVTFTLAQLPFLAGVLGIGHLLRGRAPILSNVGTSLAVLGAFGHSVGGGLAMAYLAMAADEQHRGAHAAVMEKLESGPAVAFMAMGLLGTVFGILLLAIGVWRAKVAPRWVVPFLAAFLVVAFAGSAVSDQAEQLSLVLYLPPFAALALTVWRSPIARWRSGVNGGVRTGVLAAETVH